MNREALTVMVVDDELPLREELRLFPWEAHRAEWVGEAENGEEALRLCRALRPDIVITDITMPVMGGIELFRRLKEELPRTQVILLTCHTEFAYAQEAVRLGAVQYLVKVTMEERELGEALARAAEAVSRGRLLQRGERSRLRWEASKRLRQLLRSEEADGAAARRALELCGTSLPLLPLALFVETRSGGRTFVQRELEEALEIAEPDFPFVWQTADDRVYLLLCQREFADMKALQEEAEKLLDKLEDELDRRLSFLSSNGSIRLFAAIGEAIRSEAEFASVCRRLIAKPADSFYDAECRVFPAAVAQSPQPPQPPQPPEAPQPMEPPALPSPAGLSPASARAAHAADAPPSEDALDRPWDPDAERLLRFLREDFAAAARGRRLPPDRLRALAAERLRDWLRDNGPPPDGPAAVAAASAEAATLDELVAALVRAVEAARGSRACRKEIADAKAYIAANLAAPLTLASVSAQVGLSPHYLSRLFREETGLTVGEFITDKRIEQAIRLLRHTTLKVYEVAREVGIPSYRYFAVLFRERTGYAPTDYKRTPPSRGTEDQP